jgi:Xaa-Pro aminopeptidase
MFSTPNGLSGEFHDEAPSWIDRARQPDATTTKKGASAPGHPQVRIVLTPSMTMVSSGEAIVTSAVSKTPLKAATWWEIPQSEYQERLGRIRASLESRKLDAIVLFHPVRIAYATGFFHLQSERPIAIVIPVEGEVGAIAPMLERVHISRTPTIAHVRIYPEYPGTRHPLYEVGDLLKDMGLSGKRIGYDNDGHHDVLGYRGPNLSSILDNPTERVLEVVDDLRLVKSENEVRLMQQSCMWGNLAHRRLQESIVIGGIELPIRLNVANETTTTLIKALGSSYKPLTSGRLGPVVVDFNVGAKTTIPHAIVATRGINRGDGITTYVNVDIGGYHSELERTMVVGEPSAEFIKNFQTMLDLQEVAFDSLKPGRTLAAAEADITRAAEELGISHLQTHHTGHGIGLEGKEAPFVDLGDERVIQEGMVLAIEPGFYVPGLAGFRHSETVVIREHGPEMLTYYPRDLESLVVCF